MDIVASLMSLIVSLLDTLLPSFLIDNDFVIHFDAAIAFFLTLVEGAGYFLPLNVLLACMVLIFAFDNWAILFRFGQWILKMVRG